MTDRFLWARPTQGTDELQAALRDELGGHPVPQQ
jgi:hypothetical protein